VLDPARVEAQLNAARQEGCSDALVESCGGKSIAVLPFVDMSPGKDQEHFSDGISEELLKLLASIPDLRVISRHPHSPSRARASRSRRLPAVSMSRTSWKVRCTSRATACITAQLIEGRSDTHVWSQTWDRPFDDIFAVLDEMAAAVVAQLKVKLLGAAQHHDRALALEPGNPDIIRDAAILARSLCRLDKAIALGEYAVARDPVNPRGHHNLGLGYLHTGRLDDATAAFRTALSLSPGRIGVRYTVGVAPLLKGDPEGALSAMQQESSEIGRLIGLSMACHAPGQPAASDSALDWLIKRPEPGGLAYNIANLHHDPRWLPFLRKLGQAPEQLAAIKFDVTLPR
jgi:TolB-like protein